MAGFWGLALPWCLLACLRVVAGHRGLQSAEPLPARVLRTSVAMTNLEDVPDNTTGTLLISETLLSGTVNVSSNAMNSLDGAYMLSSDQAQQLVNVVQSEAMAVPLGAARRVHVDNAGGLELVGHSRIVGGGGGLDQQPPLRIPTVFNPFRAGHVFVLGNRSSAEQPVILHFKNMTLVVANASYSQIQSSGMMDYFEFGNRSQICFSDSIFVMRSCEGFFGNFNMWCCTARQCNIEYKRDKVEHAGYKMNGGFEFLTCVPLSGTDAEGVLGSGEGGLSTVLVASVVSALLVLCLVMCAAFVLVRHRWQRHEARRKEDEMRMQIGNYEEQLQGYQERSRNDAAQLEKVKLQYKMLEMDLFAQTPSSLVRDTALKDATGSVGKLTVLDADDAQNAKSVQKQLRSVLHAADERTPVSVHAEIGRGAFGVVYRGMWKNIQVAIKTVLFQASGDIHNDPVLREAMLALRIAHPNLVVTYRANVRMLEDIGLGQGMQFTGDMTPSYQLFLLQEYCDSGTLYDWLSRERLHPGNVPDKGVIVRIALDVARGVQHLHHAEIVHGDLKPQNIMLTTISELLAREQNDPRPSSFECMAKLTDFGLSFQIDRNKSHLSNMRIGTPFYFAPEVQGKGYLSTAADMYSFGVLLWEMFHGMPPYAAENGHLVNNSSFPRFDLRHREDAPFSYVVVALACLSETHERRPSIDDVVVVLEDLNECLNGSPDGAQVLRNASLNRITKGSVKSGFAAPASLMKQASKADRIKSESRSSLIAQSPKLEQSSSSGSRMSPQESKDVGAVVLGMLQQSQLHRDVDLRKRLDVTDASELERLAGPKHARQAFGRVLKDMSGEHGVANVHLGQQWMFDILPPASLMQKIAGQSSAKKR